jgi:hypothetical protein
MKMIILICLLLTCFTFSIHATTFWSNYHHTQDLGYANFHESSVRIFCDFDTSMASNYQVQYWDGGALVTTDMEQNEIAYLPSMKSEIFFNGTNPIHVGFKAKNGNGDVSLAPTLNMFTSPTYDDLSPCTTDPIGDAAFPNTFLDLINDRVSYNETRLYVGIENNGGGFPTSQNFVFYSYMGVLSNPNNNDPNQTVYGLMYTVNQAGIISPGLYKITGTGITDLERIGDITVQTSETNHFLVMSCLWSDLLADADFTSWFTSAQSFGFMTMTQRITLTSGTVEADRGPGSTIYTTNEIYTSPINQLPIIYDPWVTAILPDPAPGCFLSIRYFDANDDVPLQAKVIFDGIHEFDFIHMYTNIIGEIGFETSMDVTDIYYSDWHTLTYRFWYTEIDYVDTTITNTGNHDPVAPVPELKCSVYPNPFSKNVNIQIENPKAERVDVSIYNIKGQLVKRIHERSLAQGSQAFVWNTDDSHLADKASGMYFLRIKTPDKVITKKMVRIN